MPTTSSPDGPQGYVPGIVTLLAPGRAVFVVAVLLHLSVEPVVAQTTGAAFCAGAGDRAQVIDEGVDETSETAASRPAEPDFDGGDPSTATRADGGAEAGSR